MPLVPNIHIWMDDAWNVYILKSYLGLFFFASKNAPSPSSSQLIFLIQVLIYIMLLEL